MADHATRVLAVTTNPSLVIGLTFLGRDWDVSSAASLDLADAPADHDVIILDIDDPADATRQLLALGDRRPPAVVVSGQVAESLPPRIRIASRPFTLDELAEEVDLVLHGHDAPHAEAGPDEDDEADEDRWEDEGGDGSHDEDEDRAASTDATDDAGPAEPARPLGVRLFGRLAARGARDDRAADETTGQAPDEARAETTDEARAARTPWVPAPEAGDTGDTDELLFADLPPADDAVDEPAEDHREVVDLARYERSRDARTMAAPATPETPAVGTMPADAEPIDVAAVASATEGDGSATRWSAREQRDVSAEEQSLRSRLARVLAAAGELERLIEEVPLLRSRPALTRAVCTEIQQELEADTVGIWLDSVDDRGWVAVSHHGFTSHEAKLIVGADQPLFAEVHATGGGLLIDPVEAVQAAVAGIGGAHTESFMAASVAIGPGRYGIIAVGRNRQLTPEDLDLLCDLAQEAAPGLAVAEQLARFQIEAPPPDPIELIDRRPRSWTRMAPSRGPAPVG